LSDFDKEVDELAEQYAKFEQLGDDAVRDMLNKGYYNKLRANRAREWLQKTERERAELQQVEEVRIRAAEQEANENHLQLQEKSITMQKEGVRAQRVGVVVAALALLVAAGALWLQYVDAVNIKDDMNALQQRVKKLEAVP
jgi:alpha-galactosidase/6-phospho-beta-glucosidase family protein